MASPVTGRQLQLLEAIRDLTEMHRHPPTLHELSAWMGMASPGGAASGVKALTEKGRLHCCPKKSRSMVITEQGMADLKAISEKPNAQG